MSRITQLSAHLADLIAAGEVVERPASVIKELFENSVDAGATSVMIEIKNGGLTMMRVTDDGSGIAADDVELAFLRHATSKISTATDLEAIGTLGFRGEALAAISSVSRVELETRTQSADIGVRIVLDGGVVVQTEPSGRPRGTTITVRDLFFNTPARQKFMKTDRAESSAILQTVTKLALSRPDVAVRYVRDGSEELRTPGDGNTEACVYSALGRDFAAGMLAFELESEGVTAHGFVSKVEAARGNRNAQHFFVNGRSVKSRTLQAALEQAYRNRMFSGRFPACVVFVELGAGRLDVNVHPSKTEIKFLFEKHVFDAVHYGALSALDGGAVRSISADIPVQTPEIASRETFSPPEKPSYTPRWTPGNPRDATASPIAMPRADYSLPTYTQSVLQNTTLPVRSPAVSTYTTFESVKAVDISADDEPDDNTTPMQIPTETLTVESTLPDFRVVGEAMLTYIIVECGDTLWLIDKHAAHERIHFDRLRSEEPNVMPQALLDPVIISTTDPAALLESSELLETLGFSVEDFGGGKLAVRQIPSDIDAFDVEGVLSEICTELTRGGDLTKRRDEILASVACKAAIKSGKSSAEGELYELAGRVLGGEVQYCPHGRPVAFRMTKSFIDKSFLRI